MVTAKSKLLIVGVKKALIRMHLKSIHFSKTNRISDSQFPFNLPMLQSLDTIHFNSPVTLFVGENGTGKSTLLEAIAAAIGSITVGAESIETDSTLEHVRRLAKCFKLSWTVKTRKGFFLRSEDFFNYAKRLSQIRAEMLDNISLVEEEYKDKSDYSRSLAMLPYKKSIYEMDKLYGEDLDANSHGESFFKLFLSRFVPGGLYLLDEPESPLSPMKQLSFISMVKDAVAQNCQFIITTHSPIIMSFPDAAIISFDELPIKEVHYDEVEHVKLTKSFLNDPGRYLKHL